LDHGAYGRSRGGKAIECAGIEHREVVHRSGLGAGGIGRKGLAWGA